MNEYFEHNTGWTELMLISLFLIAIYLLLSFTQRMLSKYNFVGRFQSMVLQWLHNILLIYEPLVLFVLIWYFIRINLIFHSILVILIIVAAFPHIRNYINGRILRYDRSLTVGNRLASQDLRGIISRTGRLGLTIKNNKGKHFLSYSQLFGSGYALLAGDDIGGFYQLKLTPLEGNAHSNHEVRLTDLIAMAPYVYWDQRPTVNKIGTEENRQFQMLVSVKEKSHMEDLLKLIEEWGYHCKIAKN